MQYVGQSVGRKEDSRLIRGEGVYVADVRLEGMLHAAVLRSPIAHAQITRVDIAEAKALPGVVDVITAENIRDVPKIPMRLTTYAELAEALQYPLAKDRVRYVGEPLAVVVAASRYEAEDALGSIEVDYEPLKVVIDAKQALETDVRLHDTVAHNIALRFIQESGDVESALAASDEVIDETFYVQRHSGTPMETRGIVANFDPAAEMLTVWGVTKVVHFNRIVLADLLGLAPASIHFIESDVGGGFGIRGEFYPEDLLIPYLAKRIGRPVAWIEDRAEHLKSANHSREQWHRVRMGVSKDGRITALHDQLLNDHGAYIRTHGATVPSMSSAYMMGPYKIENYKCEAFCTLSNKTPAGTYRAPGRYEVTFVRERVIDLIARRLNMDPAEIRRVNLIPVDEMPYDTGLNAHGTQVVYDSGDYERLLKESMDRFGYEEAKSLAAEARAAGRAVGVGVSFFVEKSGLGPWEYSRVEVDPHGRVTIFTGAADLGQGIETLLSQIVADEIGADYEQVRCVHGDTDQIPYGNGSFASRASVMAGSASQTAARQAREKIVAIAAELLEVSSEDLTVAAGRVGVVGSPDRSLSFAEIARRSEPGFTLPRGMTPGVSEEAYFEANRMVYPYGVNLALVEVSRDTGHIEILRYLASYDVGRSVNPMLVDGQIVGGFAQGLGGALFEEFAYDSDGQLLSGSFMDYLVPTVSEMPDLDVLVTEHAPSPWNPLGIKGAGEGGTTAVGATLANAVCDALGADAEVNRLPLTPERVRDLVRRCAGEPGLVADGGRVPFPEIPDE